MRANGFRVTAASFSIFLVAVAACHVDAFDDEPLGSSEQAVRGSPVPEPGRDDERARTGAAAPASNRQPARGLAPAEERGVENEEDDDPLGRMAELSGAPSSPPGPSGQVGQLGVSCLVANPIPVEPASQGYVDAELAALQHATGVGQSTSMTAAIDRKVREIMCAQKGIGLGLGVVWKGRLAYVKGYGWARGWETPSLADDVFVGGRRTRFRWASISKSITGVASMAAVQKGLLGLDLPIAATYQACTGADCAFALPTTYWGPPQGQQNAFVNPLWPYTETPLPSVVHYALTARMLLANRSGIQHYANGQPGTNGGLVPTEGEKEANPGFVWALAKWTHRPLLFLPGTKYGYSSFGFNLMGAVLQNATNETYYDFIKEHVAHKTFPAPMSTLHPDDIYDPVYQAAPYFTDVHRALGYSLDSATGAVTRDASFGDVSYKVPGGGFISTTEDMALFCEGLANHRFVSDPALVEQMWTPQAQSFGEPASSSGYGLGFSVGARKGKRLVAHNGSQEAASSRLALYPDDDPVVGKLCIVVMTNSRHLSAGSVVNAVEDLLRNPAPSVGFTP
jgi:serine beta-lactamase-like protein LACTB, mitochondrial